MEVRQEDEHGDDPFPHRRIEPQAAKGLCASTDARHAELAGESAPLEQPDAEDRLAILQGEPCDDSRDDGARRQWARSCDQQLIEAQHRERPLAQLQVRRTSPVERDHNEDDGPHRPRLYQRQRQPPRQDCGSGGGGAPRRPRPDADVADTSRRRDREEGIGRGAQRGGGEHYGERGLLPLPLRVAFPRGKWS
eukprot:gene12740-biopygen4793